MTIRHLQIFAEVCRTESITLAAEHLNMAQPAVSSVIRELEYYYGVRLFDRMNRRIYITKAGNMLLGYANSILAQLDEAKELISESANTGTLRIGSNIAFAVSHLAGILEDFSHLHPGISIYTSIQKPRIIEDALLHNELDFAIGDQMSHHDAFRYYHLMHEEVHLLCTQDFAQRHFPEHISQDKAETTITLARLSTLPLLLRESGSGSRDSIDQIFYNANLRPQIASESASSPALLQLCLKGFGIMMLPASQATKTRQSHDLMEFTLSDVALGRDYYLIYHKNKYLTRGMLWFLDYMTKTRAYPNGICPG